MRPSFAGFNETYKAIVNAEKISDFGVCHGSEPGQPPDNQNLSVVKFGAPIGAPLRRTAPAFPYHIRCIFSRGPKKQVAWINAAWVVTFMQNPRIFRYIAKVNLVRRTVSECVFTNSSSTPTPKLPIPAREAVGSPLPTIGWASFVNFIPKSLFKCFHKNNILWASL
jgi:hypothetical protein